VDVPRVTEEAIISRMAKMNNIELTEYYTKLQRGT
jgi:hypothetical protein